MVKIPDPVLRQDIPCRLPEFFYYGGIFDIAIVIHQAGDHPQHIAIDSRNPQIKCNGGNGPGGVFAQSGQFAQRGKIGGQLAVKLFRQEGGGLF